MGWVNFVTVWLTFWEEVLDDEEEEPAPRGGRGGGTSSGVSGELSLWSRGC